MTLFSEFPAPTREEWKQLVVSELEGADFAKRLVWKSPEGIDVQPLYTAEDSASLEHAGSLPGIAPWVGDARPLGNALTPWLAAQEITEPDPAAANAAMRRALGAEHTALSLVFAGGLGARGLDYPCGIEADAPAAFETLLAGIDLASTAFILDAGIRTPRALELLTGEARRRGCAPGDLRTHAAFDPAALLLTSPGAPEYSDMLRMAAASIDALRDAALRDAALRETAPRSTVLEADGSVYHEAGAGAVEELAFTLAAAVGHLRALQEFGVQAGAAARAMSFSFAVGANHFFEIAKLRAARMLWAKILRHFLPGDAALPPMLMRARSSFRTASRFDPHVNILRATLETMAAVLGGAQIVATAPFTEALGRAGELPARLARNTQIILRDEARLGAVADPAAGSHYIEQLTDAIGRRAWELFQDVERQGGMPAAIAAGRVQDEIAASARRGAERVAKRRDVIIGTNLHPNLGENPEAATRCLSREAVPSAATEAAAVSPGAPPAEPGAPSTSPRPRLLPRLRAAQDFEALRLAVENAPRKPVAFLASFGPASWRRARAAFSSGFLGTAGIAIVDGPGCDSAREAAEAAAASGADIVVACSDDESYPAAVPEMASLLAARTPRPLLLVAGNPKGELASLRAAGVDDFIFLGADLVAVLRALLARLGMLQGDSQPAGPRPEGGRA